ncbi:MAG: 4Fe-4S binding protein [Desulfobacteraceae bacterium]|nr:MAG: 4Fe-4S binding protein [Desulfobacteraceae bacterium]
MKTALSFVLIIVCVVGLSILSNRIWGEKSEQIPEPKKWVIENEMTLSQFGQANELPNSVLLEIFKLKAESDLGNKLSAYGTTDQIAGLVTKKLALASEHAAKNWIKIPLKFGLWIILLSVLFIFLRKRKGISAIRRWLLFISLLIFGVVMGSDPSPMGTVKDAIHLYGTKYVIFPPRMIALGIFLLIVFLANKFICAWGCQIGTLQDLIFHINQTDKRKAVFGKQIRLPFALTNTVRFVIFCVFTVIAFSWGFDIIEPVDPFKIYKPAVLGIYGIIFIGILLSSSLFIYRPWCHFFCPFGFVGWLVEKISLVKISVNYETCIACQKCAAACPSTVMGAILRHDKKTIPDCFSCYTCREVCPTDSIRFSSRKRTVPPVDFFEKSQKEKNIA